MSGRLVSVSSAARVLHRISARANSSLHVGPNVQLRRCDKQPLENVNVTVLHNGARATVLARELVARGARVTHFVKEGSQVPDVEGQGIYVNLDCASSRGSYTALPYSPTSPSCRSELVASLKGADVFVDSSTKGVGMPPKDVLKINARLIYSTVQVEPSEASDMRALADIACALYGREKTSVGQVLPPVDYYGGYPLHHSVQHTQQPPTTLGDAIVTSAIIHSMMPHHHCHYHHHHGADAANGSNPAPGSGPGSSPVATAGSEPALSSAPNYDTSYSTVPGSGSGSGPVAFTGFDSGLSTGSNYDTSYSTVPGYDASSGSVSGSDSGFDSDFFGGIDSD